MKKNAFSVVEIIAVLGIVVFLAAVLLPVLLRNDHGEVKTLLDFNCRSIQSQVALYRSQHLGDMPKIASGALPQLIRATNVDGKVGECGPDFPYGPYFPEGLPENPCDGLRAVTSVEAAGVEPTVPQGDLGGWLYDASTGKVYPNDAEGLRLLGYTK